MAGPGTIDPRGPGGPAGPFLEERHSWVLDSTPPVVVPGIPPVAPVAGAPDIVTKARSRIIQQYKNSPKLIASIDALMYLLQDLANAAVQIDPLDDPNTSSGVNLEVTAEFVGQTRVLPGYYIASDDELRILIRLRILRNRTIASGPEIIEAMRALLNDATLITYTSPGYMTIDVQIARAPTAFEEAAIHDDLIPRPLGVDLSASWYDPANYIGWDTDLSPGSLPPGDITTGETAGGYLAEII